MGTKLSHPGPRTVFHSQKGKVYRIPSLFYDRDRKLFMAFAEQRTSTDDTETKYLVLRTGALKEETSSGRSIEWSELKVVKEAHLDKYRPMNPCPVYEKTTKTLFLFFICVEGKVSEWDQIKHDNNKARLCYITTKDAGQAWSSVTDLTDKMRSEIDKWATFGVGPGHGLQSENGRLIVPLYAYMKKIHTPSALSLYSDDKGKSWQFGKMLQNQSIECEMAECFDDTGSFIYCNARVPKTGKYREEAVSRNNGCDFSTVNRATKLVETARGCQGSIVSFPAQDPQAQSDPDQSRNQWLLFTHPSDESKRKKLRVYLNKAPSKKDEKWSKHRIIHHGPSGYSDLVYIGDGWFACLFECGEKEYTEQTACEVFHFTKIDEGKK